MLDFVIDNIFGQLGGLVFQHMIGIPMVTNWTPLIAVVFLQASSFELGRLTGCNHPSQRSICRTPYGIDAHHTHCFIKKTYTAHGWFIERGATNESVCMTNAGLSTINNPACQMLTTPPRTVCYDCCQQMNCDKDSLYCNNYDHIDTKYMPSFMKTGPHSTVITKTTGQG